MMRFFHGGVAYDFDGLTAHEHDQDILLPDGRVLVVGKWLAVKKFFYSDEIAYHRPTALRERATLPIALPFEEAARAGNLTLAQVATFAPAETAFEQKTWLYAGHSKVEELIQRTFGRTDYTIAEGWENGSYHSYSVDERELDWYQRWERKSMYAYLEAGGPAPDLGCLLCECVLQGVLKPGEYLIYCSW